VRSTVPDYGPQTTNRSIARTRSSRGVGQFHSIQGPTRCCNGCRPLAARSFPDSPRRMRDDEHAFGRSPREVGIAAGVCRRRIAICWFVGSRFIGDTRVFGEAARLDGKARFSASNPSWDGHAWVVLGDRLLDPSIFRTAYSRLFSPPALASHVKERAWERRGCWSAQSIRRWRSACGMSPNTS
jgi:hypothetical protein